MKSSRENRREFLKKSAGLAAAGMAAPYIWTSAARAADEPEKINVGAIGVGGRGTEIGRQAAQLGNLVACADVHLGNADNFAGLMEKDFDPVLFSTDQDYRALLDDESIKAVTIGTPDHWHVKIAIDAMKAGKHVYCEKPLTLTLEEGNLICEAVKKYGKTFQVGTQQRSEFDLMFLKAVAIARSGRLGKKLHATSSVGEAGSRSPDKDRPNGPFETVAPPELLDWNDWLGQAPAVDFCENRIGWNFRWWFEYSGGQVTDWGVHHTDIAFWALAGKDGQVVGANPLKSEYSMVPREKVLGFLLGKVPAKEMPQAYNVVRSFDVDLTLSTGNVIKLISGPNELLIQGEKGRIRVNRERLTGKPVEEVDADPKAKAEIEKLMAEIYGADLDTIRRGHMANFFDCIRTGKQPVANVFDHVRAVNACHFANVALLVNRKIEWDPQAKEFKGDDEANALRSRKERDEYKIEV
jgi:myo-inositol 2-dehydrogenase / D-chiro-inositol 1-dehydrogenase